MIPIHHQPSSQKGNENANFAHTVRVKGDPAHHNENNCRTKKQDAMSLTLLVVGRGAIKYMIPSSYVTESI